MTSFLALWPVGRCGFQVHVISRAGGFSSRLRVLLQEIVNNEEFYPAGPRSPAFPSLVRWPVPAPAGPKPSPPHRRPRRRPPPRRRPRRCRLPRRPSPAVRCPAAPRTSGVNVRRHRPFRPHDQYAIQGCRSRHAAEAGHLAQPVSQCARHGRRPCRRARHAGIQPPCPGARRANSA